jgi:phytoene/squalene synthetase
VIGSAQPLPADALHEHAEGFGRLLQLTNIAKDYAVDRARGRSYVPRTWEVEGIDSVNRFVALARTNREAARVYISLLGDAALRRFCLLPLMLADRTLDLVEDNPAVLAGSPKLAHAEVARVLVEVQGLVADRP